MEIKLYMDSINMVITSPNFFVYMGLIMSFGMVFGGKLNEGMNGMRKSLMILVPFSFVLLLSTSSRLFYTVMSNDLPLGPNAYNSIFTLIFTTLFYTLGLFLGHTVVSQTIKKVYKDKGIDPNKTNNLMNI